MQESLEFQDQHQLILQKEDTLAKVEMASAPATMPDKNLFNFHFYFSSLRKILHYNYTVYNIVCQHSFECFIK